MARTPRTPNGPPPDSSWLKDAKSARALLEKSRSEVEIEELLKAGRLGVNFAEVFRYFYPYRDVVTGVRGLLNAPFPRVPRDTATIYSSNYEQEAEVSYWEELESAVNPFEARLDREHQQLPSLAPLATLSAVATEMLAFMDAFSKLRRHAARLRLVATTDPRAKKKLDSMRSTRQMFCACVLLQATLKNKGKNKNGGGKVDLPSGRELVALAVQLGHEEFAADRVTSPERVLARVKRWDGARKEVLQDLVPFLSKFLSPTKKAGTPDPT